MAKTINLMSQEFTLYMTEDCDTVFTEYDVHAENGDYIGNIAKYDSDKRWAVYSSEGNKLGERAELKAAVGMIARNWEA